MSSRRPAPFLAALALVAATLVACDTSEPALPLGTFEIDVTGNIEASASGAAWVAEPDSVLNVRDMAWEVSIQVRFQTTAGDSVQASFRVSEPTEPNGPFTELPEGTFVINSVSPDPTRPVALAGVRANGLYLDGIDGTARLRRQPDGSVEGEVSTRYVGLGGLGPGPTERGRYRLRFTARAPTSVVP